MAEAMIPDPNLAEVLRAIARDPDATFLRPNRGRFFRAYYDGSLGLSATAVKLTSAERHLFMAHREETALLLLKACQVQLAERPKGQTMYLGTNRLDGSIGRLDPARVRRQMDNHVATELGGVEQTSGLALLARCVGASATEVPKASELAIASMRMVPRPAASTNLAGALRQENDLARSNEILHHLLSERIDNVRRGLALTGIGVGRARAGRLFESLEWLRGAALASHHGGFLAFNWLMMAIQVGSWNDAVEAGAMLAEESREDDLTEYLDTAREGRRCGQWAPTDGSRVFLSRIDNVLPPTARRISDVFA